MSALEAVTGYEWWHEVPIKHPESVTGPRCVDCDTHLGTLRVQCAPGVLFCVYCAEMRTEHILTHYPDARVVFGTLTFHLGSGGDREAV